jgi:hypothetical protein
MGTLPIVADFKDPPALSVSPQTKIQAIQNETVLNPDLRNLKGAVKVKQPIHAVTQPFHRWKIIIKTNQNMEILRY